MTVAEKNIVNAYFTLFNNLERSIKSELRKKIINVDKEEKKLSGLEKSFGKWESDVTAEEEIAGIRAARRFRKKDLSLD